MSDKVNRRYSRKRISLHMYVAFAGENYDYKGSLHWTVTTM